MMISFLKEIPIDHIEAIFITRNIASKESQKEHAFNFQLRYIKSMGSTVVPVKAQSTLLTDA